MLAAEFLQVLERLNGGRGGGNPRTGICPSGLHPDGTCSCESILMTEESGTRASISRIVMLAEALFEVIPLDQLACFIFLYQL